MNDKGRSYSKIVVLGTSGFITQVVIDFLLCVVDIPAFCIKVWDWLHMPKSGCYSITNRVLLSFLTCFDTLLSATSRLNRADHQHRWKYRTLVTAMQYIGT
jgi:hypothetical protein